MEVGPAGENLRDAAVRHLAAALDDQHAGADLFHQMQQVRRQQHGGATAGPLDDCLLHPADADRIEARQRFVEEQGFGLVQ